MLTAPFPQDPTAGYVTLIDIFTARLHGVSWKRVRIAKLVRTVLPPQRDSARPSSCDAVRGCGEIRVSIRIACRSRLPIITYETKYGMRHIPLSCTRSSSDTTTPQDSSRVTLGPLHQTSHSNVHVGTHHCTVPGPVTRSTMHDRQGKRRTWVPQEYHGCAIGDGNNRLGSGCDA
jgi:hypothetical protein